MSKFSRWEDWYLQTGLARRASWAGRSWLRYSSCFRPLARACICVLRICNARRWPSAELSAAAPSTSAKLIAGMPVPHSPCAPRRRPSSGTARWPMGTWAPGTLQRP